MFGRLRLYLDQIRYADSCTNRFAAEHVRFYRRMERRLADFGVPNLAGLRALDQGSGKLYWLTLLLHADRALATGIDVEHVAPGRSPLKYLRVVAANGLERAAKTLFWDIVYSRAYYRALEQEFGATLPLKGLDLRRSSVTNLDYPDATFDLIVSHEVYEHLPDLPCAVRETARVMKPGALTYIYVHNYASVSGGHHIEWKYPDENPSAKVPPWDHLRENRFPRIPSFINRQRESVYRELFDRYLEILAWDTTEIEGKALLTPETRNKLSEYCEEELLKKGFVIIARKPERAP